MSLFGAVQQSANSLRVSELGLQVTGNNIANANTPGYIRQELIQSSAEGVRMGDAIVGFGVRAVGVVQKLDEFTLQRMRDTASKLAMNEQMAASNGEIETAMNELTGNDISTLMSNFANSFHDLANQPGNNSLKTVVLSRGQELADGLRSLRSTAGEVQGKTSQDIKSTTSDINRLTDQIAKLNVRIVEMEGGRTSHSDAVGLRDERIKALDELANLVDIQATEQASGAVTVSVGGDYLVADGIPRQVRTVVDSKSGSLDVRFVDTDAPLQATAGKLKGLYESRDGLAGGFISKIDGLAHDVIVQVNRIHSQGQGSAGFQNVLGDYAVENEFAPLEQAGLRAPIDNGTFVVKIQDARTGLTTTHDIVVKQQGLPSDSTAIDIVNQLDAIAGISARFTNEGKLSIDSDSPAIQFSFASDSSGVLAAFGVNTFFKGSGADDIQVKSELKDQPSLLAVSLDGVGKGAANALKLADAFESATDQLGGQTIREIYNNIVVDTTQEVSSQKTATEGLRNFYQTLEAKHLGTSGVSLDEEAIRMMLYQRSFQATSKLISTANELLNTLVNMV